MRKPLVFTIILVMALSLFSTAALAGGLTVTPDFLEISVGVGSSATQMFTVAGATGPLQFSASKPYLSATTADNQKVTVMVSAAGLPAGFSELATLTIKSGGAVVEVPVSVTVTGSGSGGTAFTAEPTRIDLDAVAPGSTKIARVEVATAAAGAFSAVVSSTQPWLTVQPSTLTQAEQTLLVQVDTAHLAAGSTYTGTIRISGGPLGTLEIPVMVTVAAPPAPPEAITSTPFRDVPTDHWAAKAIAYMQSRKIITGFEDGTFRPDLGVTREQFARVLVAALQLPLADRPQTPTFRDVPASRWSFVYVETAKSFMTYYSDGTFRPSELATREDIAAALVRAQGLDKEAPPDPGELDVLFSDASSISADLKVLVAQAVDHKLISGYDDGTFRPQEKVTRAQMASLLYRAANSASLGDKRAPGSGDATGGGSSQGSGSGTDGTPAQSTASTVGDGLGSAPASWPSESSIKVYTLAGGMSSGSQDGPIAQATFEGLKAVKLGSDGAVYVQEELPGFHNRSRIRKIANQQVATVWKSPADFIWLPGWVPRGAAIYAVWLDETDTEFHLGRFPLQKDGEYTELRQGRSGYTVAPVYSFLVSASGDIIAKESDGTSILRIDSKDNVTSIAESPSNSTTGSLLAMDEKGGRIFLFEGGDIKEMRLFPRSTSIVQARPDQKTFSLGSANHRGGVYAYEPKTGTFYRWAPGETGWTRLFRLESISYADSSPVGNAKVVDMTVDAKGNIILLDGGNQSIRYVQIFP